MTDIIIFALVVLAVILGMSVQFWKSKAEAEAEKYSQMLNRALAAEKMSEFVAGEYGYLKASFGQILGRQVIATLSEAQAQSLTNAVLQYLAAATTPPDKMN